MKHPPEIQWLLDQWQLPTDAVPAVLEWLDAEQAGGTACAVEVPACGWGLAAAPPESESPLVAVSDGGVTVLQSRRLYDAERAIASRLVRLAETSATPARLDELLAALFPDLDGSADQIKAARTALTRDLAIITGGPGTGKTHTLARILALLVTSGIPADAIRLAAPTGKAADRMRAAIASSLETLPEDAAKSDLTRAAAGISTIHSLLGYNPDLSTCRFHAARPLPCDVLIVDECSMVDVHVWKALLEALPPNARLILLGDPNQLESVGQGNVFPSVVELAREADSPLGASHVHLTRSRRFRDRHGIATLARALEEADVETAIEVLRREDAGLAWIPVGGAKPAFHQLPEAIRVQLQAVAHAPSPQEAVAALGRVCVLTAQREFFAGAKAMSAEIENAFAVDSAARNHPIIVGRNDPETGLRNGSVGIIHRGEDGRRQAWFPTVDQRLVPIPLARLPDFLPAWAITIHRSQGSEYDDVAVILPRDDSPLATRKLLYTAITRARRNVFLFGDEGAIRKAVATRSSRTSLLRFHLAAVAGS